MTPAITDFSQYSSLRSGAMQNDPGTLREVAGQFEALFLQTILKNMRAGQLAEPVFGSDQHEMYLEMFDRQLAADMAGGRGLGFADMLVRQLGGEVDTGAPVPSSAPLRYASPPAPVTPDEPTDWSDPAGFVADLWPHAKRAAERLGVAVEGILAQAALETGWGKHVMRRADGSSSHSLFGIKAGSDWFGGSVVRKTIEFKDGVAEQARARFRAYPDIASAFDDYAGFLDANPRYGGVIAAGADPGRFADALQDAGYATDPAYADKIRRLLGSETFREAIGLLKGEQSLPIISSNEPKAVP